MRRARVIGGCGRTTLSCNRIPILKGWDGDGEMFRFEFQESGIRAGSESHGFEARMVDMKSLRPEMLVLRGPIAVTIGSAPGGVEDQPSVGMRKVVGLNP